MSAELRTPRGLYKRFGNSAAKAAVEELKRAPWLMRAQSYRRRLFSEFDRAKQVFLP